MRHYLLLLGIVLTAACGDDDGGGPTADGAPGSADAPPGTADAAANPPGEPPGLEGVTAAHNAARAAHGVGPMNWNPSLAATAQAWADACVDMDAPAGLIDHNPNRSDGHPWYVGENIYGSGGGATGTDAVALWIAEEQDYDYASNSCSAVCGHYTQVVWAESVELGCGISNCPGLTYGNAVVCNYGPGGNSGGRPY